MFVADAILLPFPSSAMSTIEVSALRTDDHSRDAASIDGSAGLLLESALLLAELLRADYGSVVEFDRQQGDLRHTISPVGGAADLHPRQQFAASGEQSLPGYTARTGNVTVCPDLTAEERFADQALLHRGIRSGLMFPLGGSDGVFRGIGVYRKQPHEYALNDLLFAEQFLEPLGRLMDTIQQRLTDDDPPSAAAALAAENAAAVPRESRSSTRHEFPYVQKIAPLVDDLRPAWEDFVAVRCGDVSAGGVSLLMDDPPGFEEFVIALGRPPSLTHFRARVVYVKRSPNRRGPRYHVGCRFLGRYYL